MMIDPARLSAIVSSGGAPLRVAWHDELGSTNDECARRAGEGEPEGLAVVAGAQTAGRGRFDRAWASPEGNLHCSILLRPSAGAVGAPLGLVASLAVLDAVEGAAGRGTGAALKWPNDLMVGARKLCGILSVGGVDARGAPYAVVGIGVNVAARPAAVEAIAASLAEIAGDAVDATAFAAAVMTGFFARYRRLAAGGHGAQVAEWERRSGWVGRAVEAAPGGPGDGRTVRGTVVGLGPGGALRVAQGDGAVVEVHAADATLRATPDGE